MGREAVDGLMSDDSDYTDADRKRDNAIAEKAFETAIDGAEDEIGVIYALFHCCLAALTECEWPLDQLMRDIVYHADVAEGDREEQPPPVSHHEPGHA